MARMEERGPLKIYCIHYLSAGHMIPLCEIATLFASRGHHTTIITTPSSAQILAKSVPTHPFLRFHTVEFPSKEVGLLDGLENVSSVTDLYKLHRVANMLRGPIERFVEQHPPDCILADCLLPWVDDLVTKLGIPKLAFNAFFLFSTCAAHYTTPHAFDSSDSLIISSLPHPITIKATPPKQLTMFLGSMMETLRKSYGFIVNSFAELDGEEYIQHFHEIMGRKAWHIGPASLINRTAEERAERGQKSAVNMHECLTWLDSRPDKSVVYTCFGSMCQFPDKQLYEIASGMEASGHHFIWVVPEKKGKVGESEEEKEKWLPKGFEERNKDKGMVIRGWAPQLLILNHPAVGAFVTHCGTNSVVEAVSAGIPMVTWPVQGDHFYNEKLITQVRGIALELGATEWVEVAIGERRNLVSRDSIQKTVRRLMDGSDEALEIRRRAEEFGRKAREAVQEGGSSHNNLTALIHDLMRLRDAKLLHS